MITDIEQRNTRNQLNRQTLADYWQGYFHYRDHAVDLHQLAQASLLEEVERARGMERPFIDSQQVIGRILTEFGSQHRFHRQFSEELPAIPVTAICA